jgi:GT2 family glycosyltransferase
MKFSIIIPFKAPGEYLQECLQHLDLQELKDFEVILLPDEPCEFTNDSYVIVPTGQVKPARKRNIGLQKAQGEFVVFLDDDAYPIKSSYLQDILNKFEDPVIGAVGGPQLTPPQDSLLQHLSGEVLSSIGAGQFRLRYLVGNRECPVRELPSCNLAVRRELVSGLGGFDEAFLTGEDAKLCFSLADQGHIVLYSPDIQVYHHRRASIERHMRQMFIYGRDKSQLLRESHLASLFFSVYPVPFYFLSVLLVGGVASITRPMCQPLYFMFLLVYTVFVLLAAVARRPIHFPFIMIGLFLTHISYGFGYALGMVTPKPKTYDIRPEQTSQ